MPSIEKRTRDGQLRWYARYRDPAGAQLVKVFTRKVDAERFLTTVEAAKLTGSYIDAKRASITFRAFAEEHWASYCHNLAADTTRVRKRSVLDRQILPTLGNYPVGAMKRASSPPQLPPGPSASHPARSARCCGKSVRFSTPRWPTGSSHPMPPSPSRRPAHPGAATCTSPTMT